MRWLSIVFASALACGGDSPVGDIDYLVDHYDVQVDLTTQTTTVAAHIDVMTGGNCLTIASRVPPTSARWNESTPDSGDYSDGSTTLCGKGVKAGEDLVIEVEAALVEETWADLQVGYSITDDIEGQPFRYLVSWVGGCDRFGPCDAAPDRFASYRFEVTHDPQEEVLCSGTITKEPGLTICDTDYVAPTYSAFGLAASSSWTEVDMGTWGGLDITFYDMPSSATTDRVKGEVHDQFLDWLQDNFGAYPYGEELRLAVGPTVWNGFEHPGNIVLNDDLRNDPLGGGYEDRLTHVINHEIAHMWAGNRTTLASEKDFVWKEATVEYLTFAFEAEVLGETTATTTARAWRSFARAPDFYPVPDEDAPLIDFYGDAYGPGPMILYRQLEALYDRESVLGAIADVLEENTAIGVEEIQAALEVRLGASLQGYFDAWLRGSGTPEWPQFSTTFNQVGDQVTVEVTQVSPATPMGCAYAVELRGADDAERAEVWIDRGIDGQTVVSTTATVPFEVVSTRLDPHGHALAYVPSARRGDRINPWLAR